MMDIQQFKQEFLADIIAKKELSSLDVLFVEQKLSEFLNTQEFYSEKKKFVEKINTATSYKQFKKSKEYYFVIKHVREHLRKIYGVFIKDLGDREKILSLMTKDNFAEMCIKLLFLHQSTAERIKHYDVIYTKLFSVIEHDFAISQKQFTILDLACGMNPVSAFHFTKKIKKYFASDISSKDCDFLKRYFTKMKINGDAFPLDLTNTADLAKLHTIKADICFLFKALDSLEAVKRYSSEPLLQTISASIIVVSFPTKSLGGKNSIAHSRRMWFTKILDKNNWHYVSFSVENELFYVVKK